jgi:hypothetical protein
LNKMNAAASGGLCSCVAARANGKLAQHISSSRCHSGHGSSNDAAVARIRAASDARSTNRPSCMKFQPSTCGSVASLTPAIA